jgi:uncharacterized protein YgbK (DUF1537 family)
MTLLTHFFRGPQFRANQSLAAARAVWYKVELGPGAGFSQNGSPCRPAESPMPAPLHRESSAPPQFALIADDLTGACDAGVQFAQRGFSTLVRIALSTPEQEPFDVLVLTTNSRDDAPATAVSKVREACQVLRGAGREVIYKKVDSTLRGNVGAELQAIVETCGFSLALVAPAFPAMGRTLEAGLLLVAGSSQREAVHLPSLLRQQGASRVVHFGLATWADGPDAFQEQLKGLTEKTIVVLDSINDNDLETVVRAGSNIGRRVLLAGSAGLAAAAAKVIAEELQRPAPVAARPRDSAQGSAVLVMGSTHPVTQAQVNYLVKHRPIARIELAENSIQQAAKALEKRQHVLATVRQNLDDKNRLAPLLDVLRNPATRGLVLSGGDTAFAILSALSATGIKLVSEVVPGIPRGRLIGGPVEGLSVVTKAGGFGGEDALAVIADFLAQQTRTE